MVTRTRSSSIFRYVLVLAALFAGPALADSRFSDVVVFGDSLSDPGNAFVLTGQVSVPPYALVPAAPYAIGGHHFSNGKTWAERFSHEMDVRSGPAFLNPAVFSNYAVGGARARAQGPVDLAAQVSLYLGNRGGFADPDALYVVFFGGNDVRDALEALAVDPTGAGSEAILAGAVTALADNIAALAASGARHVLVFNAPDLSLVPAVRLQGPVVQGAALFLSSGFNQGLAGALDTLGFMFPGLDLVRFDLFGLLQQVVAQPQDFGFYNVTDSCITPGVLVGAVCHSPDRYLFWDGIHPTRQAHKLIARAAEALYGDDDDEAEAEDDDAHDDASSRDEHRDKSRNRRRD